MKRSYKNKLKVIAAYLVILLILIMLYYADFINNLNQQNKKAAQQIVSSTERILDQGELAGQVILEKFPKSSSCEEILPYLRELATTLPYVRSVNTGHGDKLLCSSLAGKVNVQFNTHSRLELLSSSLVQPRHPVLIIRTSRDNIDVLSVIDGVYISNILFRPADDNLIAYFNVGKVWLSQEGDIHWTEPGHYQAGKQTLLSDKYPFTAFVAVRSASPEIAFLREKWQSAGLVLLLYTILFGAVMKRLNRPFSLKNDIERGMRENEFVPYAQTIVNASDGCISGIEILMRWMHPEQGLIRPDLFIPLAEDTGQIVPMTRTLFRETARQLHRYKNNLPDSFHVGINVTASHCNDPGLLEDCRNFITTVATLKVYLTLELTERYPVEASPKTTELFKQLQDLGVVLAIDDFGTGHSSLSYFRDFQISWIKIDKSFVSQTGNDAVSEHLIDNIIDLGKRLEVSIIAEGVENQHQVKKLQAMQVDYLQGYLYSRPLPLEVVLKSFTKRQV
ncbi:EAL domain-containing protein [Enterobacter hormaechei]|uniref:EAL domain-containing protein n=1 Tax=Enterobacter hormaechei TaxID=158836 RepID=UPI002A766092|nr:EAL domain-containing protein [Enterobacter hormaechei]MDY3572442.1 EAL domain-containing protein [Enterobacter hormaechei]